MLVFCCNFVANCNITCSVVSFCWCCSVCFSGRRQVLDQNWAKFSALWWTSSRVFGLVCVILISNKTNCILLLIRSMHRLTQIRYYISQSLGTGFRDLPFTTRGIIRKRVGFATASDMLHAASTSDHSFYGRGIFGLKGVVRKKILSS